MKTLLFGIFACAVFTCCSGKKAEQSIVTIDVTKSYPEKVINLKDIADISYVQLDDSNEAFVYRGNIGMVSSGYIIGTDIRSGDILFFTKDGKPVNKFNHKGGGPNEYNRLFSILYNEGTDELYVHDFNRILVYNSKGEHKRTLKLPDGVSIVNDYILWGDKSILLFDAKKKNIANLMYMRLDGSPMTQDETNAMNEANQPSFLRISNLDASIEDYINIPEDFFGVDLTVLVPMGERSTKAPGRTFHIVTHKKGALLHNHETDTVYLYSHDQVLTPYMVQTPSVKDVQPGVYINTVVDRGGFQFIELHTLKVKLPGPLETTSLARNKANGDVFTPKIILNEYEGKEIHIDRVTVQKVQDTDEGILTFTVDELHDAYNQGKLSGELKAFVEQMNEDNENDVIAILQFR